MADATDTEAPVPAVAIDFRNLTPLQEELATASATIANTDELPASVEELLRSVAVELRDMDREAWEQAIDPYRLVELDQVALSALLALDSDEEEARLEGAELALEAMQDIFTDIHDEATVSDDRSGQEIARWLKDKTRLPNRELAELLSVSDRKLERWFAGESEPSGEDELRLRIAARIVNQLRHAMTAYGAVRWLWRPFTDLGGRSPRDLLASPTDTPRLIALAGRARRSDAS
jgi:DNA-binding transcriptional regulator YiaG